MKKKGIDRQPTRKPEPVALRLSRVRSHDFKAGGRPLSRRKTHIGCEKACAAN